MTVIDVYKRQVLVYMAVFRRMGLPKQELLRKLEDVLCFSLLLLSATIIFSYIFGLGYTTYADRYGYRGTRGFFYSGNDITAILMAGLPVVLLSLIHISSASPARATSSAASATTAVQATASGASTPRVSASTATALLLSISASPQQTS